MWRYEKRLQYPVKIQTQYGPLLVDSVKNMDRWTWMTEKWPWEGEV